MAESIVLKSIPIDHVPLVDETGRVYWVSYQTVEALLNAGINELTPRLRLSAHRTLAPKMLTVTEAARLVMDDLDLPLANAKSKVSQACDRGEIVATGKGRHRSIDPVSVNAWRLTQRDRALDRADPAP